MELREIIKKRYAAKKFDGREIPQEKIDELLDYIRGAPSSFNLQPWKVKIISDKAVLQELQQYSHGNEQISTCSHLLLFCAVTSVDEQITALIAALKEILPKEKLAVYESMMRGFVVKKSKQELLCWAQQQTYLALENALLGATALGFDSCPIAGFEPEEYTKVLTIPTDLVPTVICTVGYAVDMPKIKYRLPKEDMFF